MAFSVSWRRGSSRAVALLVCASLGPMEAQTVLQIRILEGERAVHHAGSRATEGLQVQVSDETGKPVEGAVVSFRLPEEGPGGTFHSGMKTEIAVTGPDGRTGVHGMQWNRLTGAFQVRVTAVKGELRAGTIVDQYLSDAPAAKRGKNGGGGGGRKLLLILAVAAGGAAAGLAAGMRGGAPAGSSPGAVTTPPAPPTIGAPSISIGGPQ